MLEIDPIGACLFGEDRRLDKHLADRFDLFLGQKMDVRIFRGTDRDDLGKIGAAHAS